MPTAQELAQQALALVRANSTRTGSLITAFNAKKEELVAAIGNAMTPDIMAAIEEVLTIEQGDAVVLDGALNANVPPPTP